MPMPRIIRLATPADAAQCANIYAPHVRDSAVSFEVDVPSVSGVRGAHHSNAGAAAVAGLRRG